VGSTPKVGEHNEEVLGGLLGYSAAEIADLYAKDVIGNWDEYDSVPVNEFCASDENFAVDRSPLPFPIAPMGRGDGMGDMHVTIPARAQSLRPSVGGYYGMDFEQWLVPSTRVNGRTAWDARQYCSPISRQAAFLRYDPATGRAPCFAKTPIIRMVCLDLEGRLYGCCSEDGPSCASSLMEARPPSWTSSMVYPSTPERPSN